MKFPDVVGYTLGEARIIIGRSKAEVRAIDVTSPPRQNSNQYDDTFRVVRMTITDTGKIDLLVCKPL